MKTATLRLTAAERALFEKLSATLREGWTVVDETVDFTDTPELRQARMEVGDLSRHPAFAALEKNASDATEKGLMEAVKKVDFSKASSEELQDLLFAVGPDGIAILVETALSSATSDADMSELAELTLFRRDLLDSLQPASPADHA